VRAFSRTIRSSEYHVANAWNIRCRGCWFFTFDFVKQTRDQTDIAALRALIQRERARHINAALLIGGEPTLVLDRIMAFVEGMEYVTISTNGFRACRATASNASVWPSRSSAVARSTIELRGVKPNGRTFTGLFDTALEHDRDDPRAMFVYAITTRGVEHIEPTVRRIRDHGNRVTFNYYSEYHTDDPLRSADEQRLLDEALRVVDVYPRHRSLPSVLFACSHQRRDRVRPLRLQRLRKH